MASVGIAGTLPTATINCVPGALYGNLDGRMRVTVQVVNTCAGNLLVEAHDAAGPIAGKFVNMNAGDTGVVTFRIPDGGSVRVTPGGGGTFSATVDVVR
jgi:hypothetical protein